LDVFGLPLGLHEGETNRALFIHGRIFEFGAVDEDHDQKSERANRTNAMLRA
jgi:hypothetical protein